MQDYLDPSGCPAERPALQSMSEQTRSLHTAIDRAIKERGSPYLHPEDPTVQFDLLGSRHMIAWQEAKAEALFVGESCWSNLPQVYARYGVDATRRLIREVQQLEHSTAAVLTDCGMQACALLIDVLVTPKSHAIITREVYNKTRKYLEWLCARVGASFDLISDSELASVANLIRPETTLIFTETFTNPLTRALDPEAIRTIADKARKETAPKLRLVVDNTIASPWSLKQPLLSQRGIDVVVASGTKSLGGQDRDLWGYIASNHIDLLNEVMDLQATRGGALDWRRATVLLSQLPQAEKYFRQRCATASKIARFLDAHPRIAKVNHPSLPRHPDAETIKNHYTEPGSLMSFRVADLSENEARHFADVLATCVIPRYALSFDGLATKINHHPTVSEYFTPTEELELLGFDRILRLGVGLEHYEDLIACLNWALWNHDKVNPDEVVEWQKARERELGIYP